MNFFFLIKDLKGPEQHVTFKIIMYYNYWELFYFSWQKFYHLKKTDANEN